MKKQPMIPLGSVCKVVSGATPKTSVESSWGGEIDWATPKDLSGLQGKYIESTPRKLTQSGLDGCSAVVLPENSVLLSSRAPIGHVAINKVPMATNQGFKSLVPDSERVSSSYLYYWLRANRAKIESLGNGATFKEVSKSTVENIEVPLPALDEQNRIAFVLDQADALRVKRRRSIELLDELTQSAFLDVFGDPGVNSKQWPVVTIGDLIDSTQYGTGQKAELSGDIPVLRMGNISSSGGISLRDLKYLQFADTEERHLVRNGDILFNRTNSADLVGKTAVYHGPEPMAYAGYLIRLRANSENNSEYISGYLNSRYGKLLLRNMCKSIIGMANINAKELRGIKIPQPPLALQNDFADRLQQIEKLRKLHQTHLAYLDELFASVQQRAFNGTLWDDRDIDT